MGKYLKLVEMKHTTCSRDITLLTAAKTKVLTGRQDAAGNMLQAIIKICKSQRMVKMLNIYIFIIYSSCLINR